MSKPYIAMTREELEGLLIFEDAGFNFDDAMLCAFGGDVARLGILSDAAIEALATHMVDLIHIKTLTVVIDREHWRAVAGLSGHAADIIVRNELKEWQHENWPSWGQPSN